MFELMDNQTNHRGLCVSATAPQDWRRAGIRPFLVPDSSIARLLHPLRQLKFASLRRARRCFALRCHAQMDTIHGWQIIGQRTTATDELGNDRLLLLGQF
jgi:hypothetical protein